MNSDDALKRNRSCAWDNPEAIRKDTDALNKLRRDIQNSKGLWKIDAFKKLQPKRSSPT